MTWAPRKPLWGRVWVCQPGGWGVVTQVRSTLASMAQTSWADSTVPLAATPVPCPTTTSLLQWAQWPQSPCWGYARPWGLKTRAQRAGWEAPQRRFLTAEMPRLECWRRCSTLSHRMRRVPSHRKLPEEPDIKLSPVGFGSRD